MDSSNIMVMRDAHIFCYVYDIISRTHQFPLQYIVCDIIEKMK